MKAILLFDTWPLSYYNRLSDPGNLLEHEHSFLQLLTRITFENLTKLTISFM